ncbi:MAG TPA: hypothetical protein VLD38_05425 [Nitrosopumilaceae archaeon]|nr:hypothetical protein [Nitrosopumilaceae archaeon]
MLTLKLLLFLLLIFPPALVFADEKIIKVDYGKLYDLSYDAKDTTVFEVIPNSDDAELIFEIDVTSSVATLELTIPRELLDSKENGDDSDFFIIADGELVPFSEKEKTDTTRTLFMQLSQGTTELEVFGTQLGGKSTEIVPTVENQTAEPVKEIPQNETSEKPTSEEPAPVESVPEEKPSEEVTPTEEQPSKEITQNIFDFSKLSTWSISVNERQLQEFVMTAGAFVALVIILVIFKGLRTEKSLP